jgi:hypothetical protein
LPHELEARKGQHQGRPQGRQGVLCQEQLRAEGKQTRRAEEGFYSPPIASHFVFFFSPLISRKENCEFYFILNFTAFGKEKKEGRECVFEEIKLREYKILFLSCMYVYVFSLCIDDNDDDIILFIQSLFAVPLQGNAVKDASRIGEQLGKLAVHATGEHWKGCAGPACR